MWNFFNENDCQYIYFVMNPNILMLIFPMINFYQILSFNQIDQNFYFQYNIYQWMKDSIALIYSYDSCLKIKEVNWSVDFKNYYFYELSCVGFYNFIDHNH